LRRVAVDDRQPERLAEAGLVKVKTVGIDATTLEANAALRSLMRPRHQALSQARSLGPKPSAQALCPLPDSRTHEGDAA